MTIFNTRKAVATVYVGKQSGFTVGWWGAAMSATVAYDRPDRSRLFHLMGQAIDAAGAENLLVVTPHRRPTSQGRREMQHTLHGISHWAKQRGIGCWGVRASDVKKRFTGNGNASEESMIAESDARAFGVASAAEAIALAGLHLALTAEPDGAQFLAPLADFPSPITALA